MEGGAPEQFSVVRRTFDAIVPHSGTQVKEITLVQKITAVVEYIRTGVSRLRTLSILTVIVCMACSASSCSRDSLSATEEEGAYSATISLSLMVKSVGLTDDYQKGTVDENRIDISLPESDYRIYFFTNDEANEGNDKFIARFEDAQVTEFSSGSYTTYALIGQVPDGLTDYSDIKVMALANWGKTYDESDFVSVLDDPDNATTIDDVCNAEWGQFEIFDEFLFEKGELIPFYGIQEYSGLEWKINVATVLGAPICMLRAVSKIEIRLVSAADDIHIQSVRLRGYNRNGFCAPDKVYDGSYVLNGSYQWELDSIHLIDDENEDQTDEDEEDGVRRLDFYNSVTSDEADIDSEIYETWFAYVPEYYNQGEDYSYIEIIFDDQMELLYTSEPFKVYFSEYTNGVAQGTSYYDIGRNTIYKFNVSFLDKFTVIPQNWEATFDNNFEIVD